MGGGFFLNEKNDEHSDSGHAQCKLELKDVEDNYLNQPREII